MEKLYKKRRGMRTSARNKLYPIHRLIVAVMFFHSHKYNFRKCGDFPIVRARSYTAFSVRQTAQIVAARINAAPGNAAAGSVSPYHPAAKIAAKSGSQININPARRAVVYR